MELKTKAATNIAGITKHVLQQKHNIQKKVENLIQHINSENCTATCAPPKVEVVF